MSVHRRKAFNTVLSAAAVIVGLSLATPGAQAQIGGLLILAALVLMIPVFETWAETGEVPRFPTAILASAMTLAGLLSISAGLVLATPGARAQTPLADAHIHYSHDAWDMLPPAEAIKILRKAGLRQAFVSSSNDDV